MKSETRPLISNSGLKEERSRLLDGCVTFP